MGGPAVDGMYFTAHFHRDQAATPLAKDSGRLTKRPIRKNWAPLLPWARMLISCC